MYVPNKQHELEIRGLSKYIVLNFRKSARCTNKRKLKQCNEL